MTAVLTIYVPTYKRPKSTHNLLIALSNRGYLDSSHVNVHVSDNCSVSNPNSIVQSLSPFFPSVTFSSNSQNFGYIYNFLKCFRLPLAKYCWVLGSDDIPLVDVDELLTLIQKYDFVTQYDISFHRRLQLIQEPYYSLMDYLDNVFEMPFGWLSSTIVKTTLIHKALNCLSLPTMVCAGNNPQSLLYCIAACMSQHFYSIPSSHGFVSEARLEDEAYVHLREEVDLLSLDVFRRFSRWSIAWMITALYCLANVSDTQLRKAFQVTWRRTILIRNCVPFSTRIKYDDRNWFTATLSIISAFVLHPVALAKFLGGLCQSPFSATGRLWIGYVFHPVSTKLLQYIRDDSIFSEKVSLEIIKAINTLPES